MMWVMPLHLHVNQKYDYDIYANVSKQTTLLDGIHVGPPKWRVCGHGLNHTVHEGMNDISKVKVYLNTRS